jgi:hypothetical protein
MFIIVYIVYFIKKIFAPGKRRHGREDVNPQPHVNGAARRSAHHENHPDNNDRKAHDFQRRKRLPEEEERNQGYGEV